MPNDPQSASNITLDWTTVDTSPGSFTQAMQEILAKEGKRKPAPRKDVNFLDIPLKLAFPGYIVFQSETKEGEIGLEIECEGKSLFMSPVSYWKAVQDHSLRPVDGHPPIEYVLRKPISRSEVDGALSYLASRLKASGSELKMSHRTSVHVHINCIDLPMRYVLNFISIYLVMENMLMGFAGPERRGNLFCLRAEDAEYQTEILVEAIRTLNFGKVFHNNYRYSAGNLASLAAHGSFEIRSMSGNMDVEKIKSWVELLCALKDAATTFNNPAEIGDLFLSKGPREFVRTILDGKVRPTTFDWFLQNPELHENVWNSFRAARDVLYAIDWSQKLKGYGIVTRDKFNQNIDYDPIEGDLD